MKDRATISRLRDDATEIFDSGLRAADPRAAVRENLRVGTAGRGVIAGEEISTERTLRVVAFGKAACSMAPAAVEALGEGGFATPGIVAVNRENATEVDGFRVHVGGHPVPDAGSVEAARDIARHVRGAREGDGLLVLISGGGSAILAAPAEGITLRDKVETTEKLLSSGADIHETNCVRKHLSFLKGGGLAREAAPARIESLILSDVIGDDTSTIASGPTAPDPTTFDDALDVLRRRGILEDVPPAVRERLERGARGEVRETPAPGDPLFESVKNVIVGSNGKSLDAAVSRAKALGYRTVVASRELLGEARDAARDLARIAMERGDEPRRSRQPVAILAGGETTVTVRGDGKGGRNQEMALAFALAREERSASCRDWVFLSGGTDGRDGPTDAAGGIVDPGTLERGRGRGRDPRRDLDGNDSHSFLEAAGDLLVTGGTGTNVADLQVILLG